VTSLFCRRWASIERHAALANSGPAIRSRACADGRIPRLPRTWIQASYVVAEKLLYRYRGNRRHIGEPDPGLPLIGGRQAGDTLGSRVVLETLLQDEPQGFWSGDMI
jgi:hypothetical protein